MPGAGVRKPASAPGVSGISESVLVTTGLTVSVVLIQTPTVILRQYSQEWLYSNGYRYLLSQRRRQRRDDVCLQTQYVLFIFLRTPCAAARKQHV